jgi:L-ascorbate metabolism protein UlaG (beta-lactamase superfamily)
MNWNISGRSIHCVPALHFSARGIFDRNKTLWCGYVIKSQASRVFRRRHTGFGHHFAHIREKFGPPNLALLPIGAYEPHWSKAPVHMSPEEAVKAHNLLGCSTTFSLIVSRFPSKTYICRRESV